jgi:hypothetical protein
MTGNADNPLKLQLAGATEAPPAPDEEGDRRKRGDGLPEGCPIIPLGIDGNIRYYLDAAGQLAALSVEKHSRLNITGLYGAENHRLYQDFPKKNENQEVVGWRPEKAAETLMRSASECGPWSPAGKVRGRGCWSEPDGGLLVHTGSSVLTGGQARLPGIFGDYVLLARPPITRPAPLAAVGGTSGVGAEVLSLLGTWNWHRKIDARLMLGCIGACFLGGALRWRPILWIVGGFGTGKSTLLDTCEALLGGWLLKAGEPTPAGLWQSLGHDCLAVAIDEAEAEHDNRRLNALVKLARVCASGDKLLRGSSEGEAAEYSLRSVVLFGSIRQPPLLPQDRSRIIVLRLGELTAETAPSVTPARLQEMGARILRRVVDGWPRLPAVLEQYSIALRAVGHRSRAVDVFGTALAIADLILSAEPLDSDSAGELAAQLDATSLSEADDNLSDQEAWLRFLRSSQIPIDGPPPRNTVFEWLRQAVVNNAFDEARDTADRILGNYGLKIIRSRGALRPTHFAVANRNAGLERLHATTHWAGRSGALGVFVQAARDLPGANVTLQRFGGMPPESGTAIPLALVGLDPESAPAPRVALPLETEE